MELSWERLAGPVCSPDDGADAALAFSKLAHRVLTTYLSSAAGRCARVIHSGFHRAENLWPNPWSYEVARMVRSLASGDSSADRDAALYMVRNGASDITAKFDSGKSPRFAEFLFGNKIDPRDPVQVDCRDDTVTVVQGGEATRLRRRLKRGFDLVATTCLPTELRDYGPTPGVEIEELSSEAGKLFDDVMALAAATYLSWISNVLHTVILSPSIGKETHTGSWGRLAGVVFLSEKTRPKQLLEGLVHEACHQYFYLGNWFHDYVTESGETFFSPAVSKTRPTWTILLSFHAFANITLMYERLGWREHPEDRKAFQRNYCLAAQLDRLLDEARTLSKPGKAVYETLRDSFRRVSADGVERTLSL